MAGRRGRKTWPEGVAGENVAGRRGRKAWSENLPEVEGVPSRPNETRSEDSSQPPLSSSLEFTETKTRLVQTPSLSRALFRGASEDRDVGLNTCLPKFTLSSGVKSGANANLFMLGSLPVSSRSCSVPPEVSGTSRFLQKRCSFRAMSQTHATEDTSLVTSRLWQENSRAPASTRRPSVQKCWQLPRAHMSTARNVRRKSIRTVAIVILDSRRRWSTERDVWKEKMC